MALTDYTIVVNQSITGGSTTLLRWQFILNTISALINDPVSPWTVRGSSRNGSSGAAFSSTPDGVDYWTGQGQTAVAGAGNPIWMVLQNTATGHQVCFLLGTGSGPVSSITVVFALNKFETGGAWRGGGSGTATRPTDVTSSPTAARELNTAAIGFSPQSTSNEYFCSYVRKDGKGFYIALFRDTTPSTSSDGFFMGYYPLNTPQVTDLNPYLAFTCNNQGMGSTAFRGGQTGCSMVGRLQDGTLQEHETMDLNQASLYLNRINPWYNAVPIHGVAVRSVTTKDTRLWMPDVFICSGSIPSSASDFMTRGSKSYFKLNPSDTWGLVIPWDGTTTRGTDVAVFRFPDAGLDGPSVTPAPSAPTNLAAVAGNAQISLTWDVSAGATTYSVKRSLANGGPYTNLVVTGLAHTYYVDSTTANGTPYYYVVTATNAQGESGNSSQVTATPAAPVPPVVDTIVPSNGSQLGGTTAITFHVTDVSPGLYKTYIWIQIAGETSPRLVFDNTVFKTPFLTLSTRNAITNGYAYSLQFDGGWPGVVSSVTVAAIDSGGAATETTFGYIAVPPPPLALQIVRAVDARTLEIVFNRAVVQSQAENVANYSISPTLAVTAATKVTDFNYRLTTSQQIINQAYGVTISGISPA